MPPTSQSHNKVFADKTATGVYEDGSGGKVAGFHSNETRDSYINDVNIDSTELLFNAAAHESSHEMDAQDSVIYSQSDNEAYANNFGSNLASYTNLALDINGYDDGMASTNNHVGNTSNYVEANTAEYTGLDKEQGDNFNMGALDMNPWHAPEAVKKAAAEIGEDLNKFSVSLDGQVCAGSCLKGDLSASTTNGISGSVKSGFGLGVTGGAGLNVNLLSMGDTPRNGLLTTESSVSGQFLFFGTTVTNYSWDQNSLWDVDFNLKFPGGIGVDANTGLKRW